ncbi:hypothetical protein QYE76_062849 [Lolium multiflorum]|uniref:Glabrous enhancer-binding protein-like DBD domain-containing protein n=1 Tax=Lolium multiflorum TaxID=4521 RepID=A0AAD8S3T9_LOLMU|nr:hypothetical protein QYE76_062849 [Lolium multiflorum]
MASESDQTLPLPPPLPAPSNPNQIHTTPTAPPPVDDSPTPPPTSISAARKLPIKRRSPPRPTTTSPSSSGPASSGAPAFKFQRIWSETDELRLLQGLLGCGPQGQGLLFPRDLNVFYDQFSESMPQPYTRSQLSEKLRRLRNKHRAVAARVAKGLDPARLAPHDRDVLHLCSRLWDPAYAANSPFAGPDSANKRRRANPHGAVAPLDLLPAPSGDSSYNGGITSSAAAPGATFPDENDVMYLEQESSHNNLYFDNQAAPLAADPTLDGVAMSQPSEPAAAAFANIADNGAAPAFTIVPDNGAVAPAIPHIFADTNNMVPHNGSCKAPPPRSNDHRVASAVLDIFEECMREAKAQVTTCEAEESQLAKRWRQQRIDELDVLSRRLRLIIEDATTAAAGH